MDLFDKCKNFTVAKEIQSLGVYPYFHRIETPQNPVVICEGKKMIMMGSNNYLGLASNWKLKMASIRSIQKYGVGCVGSRFLNGTLDIHEKLEEEIADFIGKPKCIVFTTGMQANLGVISAIVGKDNYVITDKYDHASIIDGCKLSFGKMLRFKHNDMEDLERVLKQVEDKPKLIVVDGVFSMEGDIAPIPKLVELKKKYNARLLVDDAHGIGVMGRNFNGKGTCDYFGLTDEVDLIVGTFSKSLASIGGFVVGGEDIIHYIKHMARALIFSASPSPSNVASVLEALKMIKNGKPRIKKLWKNTHYMKEGLESLGFNTGESTTPIIPVIVGDNLKVFQMWRMLFDLGVFTTPVVSPAVPPNRALIRVSMMATHSKINLDKALDAFEKVGKEIGIITGGKRIKKKKKFFNRRNFLVWMANLWRLGRTKKV